MGFILLLLLLIPVRLSIAAHQAPRPQAILVLGGDPRREEAAAQLAHHYPDLEVWVSTGEVRQRSETIFRNAGIADDRVHLDYRAVDTVTNFTTLVADFKRRNIQHVFVVTSDFHMTRAKAIATVVLGSQGIAFTPVSVSSDRSREAPVRVWRDIGRSVMWIFTGRTGSSIGERLKDDQ
ncbi:YdcF family protein [Leptolyngbya ohadii]|uniref:YdcF family protein n=1 Tax=Leptolyngbya ohadii TaxID=1962290 RepID=UPI001CEC1E6F|nr:YdcF family protein [Leptolyngbya ohadii]